MSEKIVLEDIKPYEHLFTSVPAFLLERMAKRKSNLVKKFESPVRSRLNSLNEHQRNKLHVVLNSEIRELQKIMDEAYKKTNKKQYKVLANPKYKEFIEYNLDELKKMI